MPHRLKQRQAKIQEKRKSTPWREFVMELCSWYPLVMYKTDGLLSRYPQQERKLQVVLPKQHSELIDDNDKIFEEIGADFFQSFQQLFSRVPLSSFFSLYKTIENCEYADIVGNSKNAYLSWNVSK